MLVIENPIKDIDNSYSNKIFKNNKSRRQNLNNINLSSLQRLERLYQSQGMVGKLFDLVQGSMSLDLSHKNLTKYVRQEKDSSKVNNQLEKYYNQQTNEVELATDLITGLVAAKSFKFAKKASAYSHIYAKKGSKFEKMSLLMAVGLSSLSGMLIKPMIKGLNYLTVPIQDRKKEHTLLRDIGSGFVDGLAAPLMYASKLGIVATLGVNSASRFLFNKKMSKDSSKSYSDLVSSGWLVKIPALAVAGLSALKFHKSIDKIETAIVKSKENIKNIKKFEASTAGSELIALGKLNLSDRQTQADLITSARKGFFSNIYVKLTSGIRKILGYEKPVKDNKDLLVRGVEFTGKPLLRTLFMSKDLIKENEMNGVMCELEKYNIFYPKMLQTLPSNTEALIRDFLTNKLSMNTDVSTSKNVGWLKRKWLDFKQKRIRYIDEKGIKTLSNFINKYKSKCPASRSIKEAQNLVKTTFVNRFVILGNAPIGVGTIAESYLAKDSKTNQEVVIKVTKKWATAQKLANDKIKMQQVLNRVKDKLDADEYNYQMKMLDELYNAWVKEVNLNLEAEAADILGKYAEHYNTVKPIAVKDNIFVMEKAKGVQFDQLGDYMEANNITLSSKEATELLGKYTQVFLEQLFSVPQKGDKVMHADPHAGNIFIDLANKEKPFTFIDTGNVLRFTPDAAIKNVTSHVDYLIGNAQNISERLLEGAILPNSMTQKEAEDLLTKHLKETFFSGKYKIGMQNPFSTINNESIEFMKKNKVILNADNANMLKAEIQYIMNMLSLSNVAKRVDFSEELEQKEVLEIFKKIGIQVRDSITNGVLNNKKCTISEVRKRIKYIDENPEQFITTLYSYLPPEIVEKFSKKAN